MVFYLITALLWVGVITLAVLAFRFFSVRRTPARIEKGVVATIGALILALTAGAMTVMAIYFASVAITGPL